MGSTLCIVAMKVDVHWRGGTIRDRVRRIIATRRARDTAFLSSDARDNRPAAKEAAAIALIKRGLSRLIKKLWRPRVRFRH